MEPTVAACAASTFAIAGLTEALRPGLAHLGIGSWLLYPSAVSTRLKDSERNPTVRFGPRTGIEPPPALADTDTTPPAVAAELALRGIDQDSKGIVTPAGGGVEELRRHLLEASRWP